MRVLVLSAYDTDSHKSWCQGLMKTLPDIEWHYLTLPGRYFSWRIRGNPLSWAFGDQQETLNRRFDKIIATSMVDLSTLRGLVPNLAVTPAILYFHENQFAYPKSHRQHGSIEPQMVNLYAALSAEQLVFNTCFNQQSFLQGVDALLRQLPDQVPKGMIQRLEAKSRILPVGIFKPGLTPAKAPFKPGQRPLRLVWNHRWEYDKGPEILARVVRRIDEQGLAIKVSVLGRQFRSAPAALTSLIKHPANCIEHIGTLEHAEDYHACLAQQDVVLSTAIHEFQGLAMLEACAHGCVPLAPDRLAYPEWVPSSELYSSAEGDIETESQAIVQHLKQWLQHGLPHTPDVSTYYWHQLRPSYAQLFQDSTD